MAIFTPKSFQQILISMVSKMAAETPITDFNDGSVVLTLLEAAAQEDFQQYIQMLQIIRNFNLDTTEGDDLDNRASEFGIARLPPKSHSGSVTITDTRFDKIFTKIYAGLPGPITGATKIFVNDASSFPASGSVFVGRGTVNSEGPISYSSAPVDNTAFWEITLDTALINDHGTDETVILAQFGNRVIDAGVEVEIPETDVSDRLSFELNQTIELNDGENIIEDVLVTALEPGGFRVPANSVISFVNTPFTGASVTNPLPFTNGRDEETDQELRDRIRDTIQSLSRGVTQAIRTGIVGLIDEVTNSSIISTNIVPPVILADGPTKVFIDNGRGLEPTLDSVGLETLSTLATGGEKFFQLLNFPLVKASVISQNVESFSLFGGETLIFKVGTDEESFQFISSDFSNPGSTRGTEVVEALNNRATLIDARTINTTFGRRVIITPKSRTNETLQIDENSTANIALNFTTNAVDTLRLYKNDRLLTKDGLTASIISSSQPFDLSTNLVTTTDSDITISSNSRVVTKTVAGTTPFTQFIHPGDYIKFSSDSSSFYIKVRTIVSDLKVILEAPYPPNGGGTGNINIWNSPQLEVASNGDNNETETVSFGPNDFSNPFQALASEVFSRLNQEINLSRSELAVNNTRVKLISNLENSEDSKIQILGGSAAVSLGFSAISPITGTLTFVGGNVTITGSGTAFKSELEEGQWIKANSDGNGSWTKIETIESDTILYLREGYRGLNSINSSSSAINFGDLIEGKNKDYSLNTSNGQLELNTPLLAGDDLTAGSVNTRGSVRSFQETFDFGSIGASSSLIVCIDGGFVGSVVAGDGFPPFSSFTSSSLIGLDPGLFLGFYLEWTSGNNIGETSFVGSYNSTTGEVVTISGFTNPILVGDKFKLCQVVNFTHVSDFADPSNATSLEVTSVINSQILGGFSEKLENNSIRLRTSNFGSAGKIQVVGGSANQVLGFSTEETSNQETNLAFVTARNSDRNGNPDFPGYTLGPNQRLVLVVDGDSPNKTFNIPLSVTGSVSTGGSGSFSSLSVGAKYTSSDFFNGFWIYWTSGANDGSVQVVTDYTGVSGAFIVSDVFPSVIGAISPGDSFALIPRTAENVVALMNDFNTTTVSIVGTSEVVGISGDFVQVATRTPGSDGKMFVTGGTANSIGINIQSIPAGSPVNDITTNSKAGLSKGLLVSLTADGEVTTPDNSIPFDTFKASGFITALPNYFTGFFIKFLSGANEGFEATILSYNNSDGEIVLSDAAVNAISVGDSFRVSRDAFVVDIQGTTAPHTISVNDDTNTPIDVSGFTPQRLSAIRDRNGLNFSNIQVEGIDGYKHFTGLIQKAQFTIDGLDRDPSNFPGIGAVGTQFEVLSPVLVKIRLVLNVTPDEGVSLSSISGNISNAVLEYVNSRGVGEDVILSEIVASAQSVVGVFDVEVENFSDNITIADGELARLDVGDLTIG